MIIQFEQDAYVYLQNATNQTIPKPVPEPTGVRRSEPTGVRGLEPTGVRRSEPKVSVGQNLPVSVD